jgi:hypothetical protein
MLSGVLNSSRAVGVNIEIMRTFVRLRQMLATNADLARRLDELEKKYDRQFGAVFDAIRQLMIPPDAAKNRKSAFMLGVIRNEGWIVDVVAKACFRLPPLTSMRARL